MPDRDFQLATERLVLRPTRPQDAVRFVEIQSDWNVTRMLRMAPWPPDPALMTQWVEGHGQEWAAGTAYRFAVEREGRVIGVCDLDEIADGQGDLGYWYEQTAWGQGYAREAARAVLGFALDVVRLIRLRSGHAADNPASGKVLLGLGFRATSDTTRFSRSRGCEAPYRTYMFETS